MREHIIEKSLYIILFDNYSFLVSVIIPNYNHSPFLKQRIESVLSQTCQDFELIILDDCSTDNSKEIIEQYRENKKVSHIRYNEKNSGSTFKQWQKGLKYAKGEFVWIAESDDFADKEFLSTMTSLLINHRQCIFATSRTAHVDGTGEVVGINLWPDQLDHTRWCNDFIGDGTNEIINYLRFRDTIPNASAVVFSNDVKAELETVVKNDWRYNGDWFFWAALLKKGSIGYSSKILNFQRFHSQTTRSVKPFIDEEKRFKETVAVITYLNNYSKKKINWFDLNYNWIFEQLVTRIKIEDKINVKYYGIGNSASFGARLLLENFRFYYKDFYNLARFKGGAVKQKVFIFFKKFK